MAKRIIFRIVRKITFNIGKSFYILSIDTLSSQGKDCGTNMRNARL
jgi:hypothetical protein